MLTMAICPTSTPRLNHQRQGEHTARQPQIGEHAGKTKPCISPKQKAITQRLPRTIGNRLLSAASTTDMAMADSQCVPAGSRPAEWRCSV